MMNTIHKSSKDELLYDTKSEMILTDIIRNRRSIYANEFIGGDIPDEVLTEILTNATWAPTHKMTEPWRFIVFRGKYLKEYGEYMSEYYREYFKNKLSHEDFLKKDDALKKYPLKAACMIGVVLSKHLKASLPEWEEVAAVSSAVHNIALTCTSYNIGSYWSTPDSAIDFVKRFGLKENEQSLGLIFMGYYDHTNHHSKKKRTSIDEKVSYLE